MTTATRKVDELGRIALPAEIRANLNIAAGEELNILQDEHNQVILKKKPPRCALCCGAENLISINGKYICITCKKVIAQA